MSAVLLDFDFEEEEQGLSVATFKVGPEETESFLVGAATILPTEVQAKRGRIMLWQQQETGYEQVGEYDTKGSPYALAALPEGRVAVAVNSQVSFAVFTHSLILTERLLGPHHRDIDSEFL